MAKGDAPVLEALADINAVSLDRTDLDPRSLILVRLAALIAVDAPASSYLFHIAPAASVGVTLDQPRTCWWPWLLSRAPRGRCRRPPRSSKRSAWRSSWRTSQTR